MNYEYIMTIISALLLGASLGILLAGWVRQQRVNHKLAAWVRSQEPAPSREWITCPYCNGEGGIEDGRRDSDTGYALGYPCPLCAGRCEIRVEEQESDIEQARI